MEKPKFIEGAILRTKTVGGEVCHYHLDVLDNGVCFLVKKILSTDFKNEGWEKVTTRFGKTLWRQVMGLKPDTIYDLFNVYQQIIVRNKINI